MIFFSQCKETWSEILPLMHDFVYCAARRRKIIANYVTSGLGHQRARKVLFTCMVHATISEFSLDKSRFSQEDSLFF